MLYVVGVLLAAVGGLFYLSRRDSQNAGKTEAVLNGMKGMLDDVQRVKAARDALAGNDAAAERLRNKYTRP